ncbi:hypothetical protein ACVWYN_000426 [Pedobacter sp. UYP24]
MGQYKKGILGHFRGKVGTVIGSIWNGIYYMRSLPDTTNSTPTQSQLNVRIKFAIAQGFLKRIKALINIGYQKFTDGISPMNAATSYTLKYAITGVSPNYTIDYSKVVVSAGDLDQPYNPGMIMSTPAEIKFNWDAQVEAQMDYGKNTDTVTFLVFCPILNKFTKVSNVVPRSALTYTLSVPAEFSGELVHAWMVLTSVDGKEVSESYYMGPLTVL